MALFIWYGIVYSIIQRISRPNKTKLVHEPKDKDRMEKQIPSDGPCTQASLHIIPKATIYVWWKKL